ncbi:MAG: hypothetical protein WC164_00835 [Patescibacteria group bacterium]
MNEIKNKRELKKIIPTLLEKNPIIAFVCQKTGISRQTYYRWLEECNKFKSDCESAILDGKQNINDLAYSKLVELIKSSNITAIIFWLKNNHPDFKESSQQIRIVQEKLSPGQSKLLEKALNIVSKESHDKEIKVLEEKIDTEKVDIKELDAKETKSSCSTVDELKKILNNKNYEKE